MQISGEMAMCGSSHAACCCPGSYDAEISNKAESPRYHRTITTLRSYKHINLTTSIPTSHPNTLSSPYSHTSTTLYYDPTLTVEWHTLMQTPGKPVRHDNPSVESCVQKADSRQQTVNSKIAYLDVNTRKAIQTR